MADTEEILSGEIGVKSELLDRRLRLGTTAYVYEVDGQQITAVGGEFNVATLLNADKTAGYGLEMDLAFAPRREWLFTVGTSYSHTEIQDDTLAVAPAAAPCSIPSVRTGRSSTETLSLTRRSGSSPASSTTATRRRGNGHQRRREFRSAKS